MKRGAWHQCGDKSQKLVLEQLQKTNGVGVVLSPRDLSAQAISGYAQSYRDVGAEVLFDPQFYVPDFTNKNLETYELSKYRTAVSTLNKIADAQVVDLRNELRSLNSQLQTSAVIAPAVLYEAGRVDIHTLNAKLFSVAKQVGDELGVPTYATVGLARSVTASEPTTTSALSSATALNADGWYYAFEFQDERLPTVHGTVLRCCSAGLALAATGKPLLHAYAGPMGLLSFGFGATGAGVGHSQNLWKFSRERWEPTSAPGGGGDAPPRYFSPALWGTIIYPDETSQLPSNLWEQVKASSQFCVPVTSGVAWNRWDAGKHLVCVLVEIYTGLAATPNPRQNAQAAIDRLQQSIALHQAIKAVGVKLRDDTDQYQLSWKRAMEDLLTTRGSDFDYLALLT